MRTAKALLPALLLVGCGAGGPAPRLRVSSSFDMLTIRKAYAGTSYHVALGEIEAIAGKEVTFRDIGFETSDGLRDGITGWLTSTVDPGAIRIGSTVGDLVQKAPKNTFVPLAGARIAPGDGRRWDLLVTVVPARKGQVAAKDAVVRYRDAFGHFGTVRIRFALTIEVESVGTDPRVHDPVE